VLRCTGRIVHGDGADTLLRTVMFQDDPHIQIDLSGVNAIDAGGLGVLAALERRARDTGRTIQLMNPTKRVREALDTTGLSAVLQICPTIPNCNGYPRPWRTLFMDVVNGVTETENTR
jgi:anti-anti-sigma factor